MNAEWVALAVALLFSPLLIYQSRWVYKDAEKNGMNKWGWGIFCLFNTPSNWLIYLLYKHLKQKESNK